MGGRYALREGTRSRPGTVQQVELVAPMPLKGRANVVMPHGLEASRLREVRTQHLPCPWAESDACLVDEARRAELRLHDDNARDPVLDRAAEAVLVALGRGGSLSSLPLDQGQALWARAGLEGSIDVRSVKLGGRGQWRIERTGFEPYLERIYTVTAASCVTTRWANVRMSSDAPKHPLATDVATHSGNALR